MIEIGRPPSSALTASRHLRPCASRSPSFAYGHALRYDASTPPRCRRQAPSRVRSQWARRSPPLLPSPSAASSVAPLNLYAEIIVMRIAQLPPLCATFPLSCVVTRCRCHVLGDMNYLVSVPLAELMNSARHRFCVPRAQPLPPQISMLPLPGAPVTRRIERRSSKYRSLGALFITVAQILPSLTLAAQIPTLRPRTWYPSLPPFFTRSRKLTLTLPKFSRTFQEPMARAGSGSTLKGGSELEPAGSL
ncbi:hypothetical protein B0H14DRAFT_3442928 [Mycena olivaceomarginata]|nr:hypothetical protein B0H14DRAFT_3442928 [Mycena olivaceomarginata]